MAEATGLRKTELKILDKLVKQLERRLLADANNDMFLEATDKNMDLVNRAEAWSRNMTLEKWLKSKKYKAPEIDEESGKIVTNNGLITQYIRSRIENVLERRDVEA